MPTELGPCFSVMELERSALRRKWSGRGSAAQPTGEPTWLRGRGGQGEIRTHDLFHAMEAPDNELQPLRLGTKDLRTRDLAQIWHVVVRIW
jgi:hypothetical protein